MSGRFVSTGAIDTKTGDAVALPTATQAPGSSLLSSSSSSSSAVSSSQKKDEWAAVQAQLEAERQAREAKRKAATSSGEKSLYEVLEANKAAKQAAFEEANKIKNQFRALDEDEIGFLEEVEMKKREEAETRRREMEEGLRVFREARKGEKKEDEGEEVDVVVEGGWKVGGKRKRKKGETEVSGMLLKCVKRRVSGGEGEADGKEVRDGEKVDHLKSEEVSATSKSKMNVGSEPAEKASAVAADETKPKPKLGLVAYGSDDEDDDESE